MSMGLPPPEISPGRSRYRIFHSYTGFNSETLAEFSFMLTDS
jgi:hypothetical protein